MTWEEVAKLVEAVETAKKSIVVEIVKKTAKPVQPKLPLEIVLATPALENSMTVPIDYRDHNYAGRIGWKEIVARPGSDAAIVARSRVASGPIAIPKS